MAHEAPDCLMWSLILTPQVIGPLQTPLPLANHATPLYKYTYKDHQVVLLFTIGVILVDGAQPFDLTVLHHDSWPFIVSTSMAFC